MGRRQGCPPAQSRLAKGPDAAGHLALMIDAVCEDTDTVIADIGDIGKGRGRGACRIGHLWSLSGHSFSPNCAVADVSGWH